ncbi:GMC oxidoreductase [Streptomyces ureilyticus]|uniref:Cholesterol oxidase n=1 Tax=Streptomyces ureilyticus TaxID=1775131 RepID=A0ABX0DXK2_9ACTN|nr:GMC family oxidoreductase [Streptomyces ureilyticus]NGO43757.1 GMC family oxidoreductase [Streptomyces ureilyticus]
MRQRYDALVVGTGFGGAVSACRLAQAGLKVGVLERGRRYPLGGFPRDWENPLNGWLWEKDQGLFDVRPFSEMTVVQGAAYGGGSHLYANVHLRVPGDGFEQGWPSGYERGELDPYYDLVAWMLDLTPVSERQPLGVPPKTTAMREAARAMGRERQFALLPLALNLGEPEVMRPNKFGVPQSGCRHCGECDIGCNFQAKNTLDLNYLAVAEQHGAEVGTRCEVTRIEPLSGDTGYRLTYTDHATGADQTVSAPVVVLAAGAVNSTELLLRCRDEYGTLPKLSERLGHRYSGNGDYLGFAFGTDKALEPSRGPVITSGIVHDRGSGKGRRWFIFQEGAFPREIAGLIRLLDEGDPRFAGLLRSQDEALEAIRSAGRERIGARPDRTDGAYGPADAYGAYGPAGADGAYGPGGADGAYGPGGADGAYGPGGADEHTAVFLAMGRDTADGRISLLPGSRDLRISWNLGDNLGLYETEERFCADVAAALGGRPGTNPLWRSLHIPVSVHNLGGCVMADDPADGVTDTGGEVFGYPNLFVLDGGCLPEATGVNPSFTIAAVAERNIEAAIRRITGQAEWRAPEREFAVPVPDPLDEMRIPVGGTPAPSAPGTGLAFTETMHGTVLPGGEPREDAAPARFRVTVTAPVLTDTLDDPAHPMAATGTVYVRGVTGTQGAQVSGGVVNLLTASDGPAARQMLYTLPFFGADGQPYLLDGVKDVRDHGRIDVWGDIWGTTTTLHTTVRRGHAPDGATLSSGVLRLGAADFLRQLTTVRITGTRNPVRQAEALARFGVFFAGSVWDVFVRPRIAGLSSAGPLARLFRTEGASDD